MSLDNAKNFAKATVSTGYDASATSIVLTTGHGAKLPTAPFNVVWWNATDYADPSDDPNVEIVRVTAKSTDTLTVTRAQESTSASTKNTAGKTYLMIAGPTAKMLSDLAEVRVAAHAGDGYLDAATVAIDSSGILPVVAFADGNNNRVWHANFLVPQAADGKGISKIDLFYKNRAASSLNIYLLWRTFYWAKTGGTLTQDTNTAGSLHASPSTAGDIGVATAPADAFNGMPATFNAGDMLSVSVNRQGADASDTYGQTLDGLSIVVTFA